MVYGFRLGAGSTKQPPTNLITGNCRPRGRGHHRNGNLSALPSLGHFKLLGNTAYFLPSTQEVLWANNDSPALYSCLNLAIVCPPGYLSAWHHQSARSNVFLDTVQLWLPDGKKTQGGGGRGGRGQGGGGQSWCPFVSLTKDISLCLFSRAFFMWWNKPVSLSPPVILNCSLRKDSGSLFTLRLSIRLGTLRLLLEQPANQLGHPSLREIHQGENICIYCNF